MKKCLNCGKELRDDEMICPYCNCEQNEKCEDSNKNELLNEYRKHGTNKIKKKVMMYRIVLLSCLGVYLLMMLIALLVLLVPTEGDVSNTSVALTLAIIFTVIFFTPVIIFLILILIEKKKYKDDEYILSNGKIIYDEIVERKKRKEERIATKQQKLDIANSLKNPDFEINKEFICKTNSNEFTKIWINTDTRQIQFRIPMTVDRGSTMNNIFKGTIKMVKTKIFSIDDISSYELIDEEGTLEVKDGYVVGSTTNSAGIGSGSFSKESITTHHLQLVFHINDIDFPVIRIYYGNDIKNAELLYETMKILKK